MAALEVDWVIVVGRSRLLLPVRLGHCEPHLCGDVAGVATPSLEVKRPCALAAAGLLLDVVNSAALAQRLGCHFLHPAVNRHTFNAYLDAVLPADVGGIAPLVLGGEVEDPAAVGEDSHVHHALPDCRVGEDDEVVLGEVLDHLEVVVMQVELVAEGIAEVIGLHIVAASVDLAHRGPTDELISAAPDGASGRHNTEAAG